MDDKWRGRAITGAELLRLASTALILTGTAAPTNAILVSGRRAFYIRTDSDDDVIALHVSLDGASWKEVSIGTGTLGGAGTSITFIGSGTTIPVGTTAGQILWFTAARTGLTGFVDTDGSTAVTSAQAGDIFELENANWVKRTNVGGDVEPVTADDDDFDESDPSRTEIKSERSIKAYVDEQVENITAGQENPLSIHYTDTFIAVTSEIRAIHGVGFTDNSGVEWSISNIQILNNGRVIMVIHVESLPNAPDPHLIGRTFIIRQGTHQYSYTVQSGDESRNTSGEFQLALGQGSGTHAGFTTGEAEFDFIAHLLPSAIEQAIDDAIDDDDIPNANPSMSEIKSERAIKAYVDSQVSAETTSRQTADTTLQDNIDAEASARSTADTALSGRLDTLESAPPGGPGTEGRSAILTIELYLNATSTPAQPQDSNLRLSDLVILQRPANWQDLADISTPGTGERTYILRAQTDPEYGQSYRPVSMGCTDPVDGRKGRSGS